VSSVFNPEKLNKEYTEKCGEPRRILEARESGKRGVAPARIGELYAKLAGYWRANPASIACGCGLPSLVRKPSAGLLAEGREYCDT
jgi:hypothetical protein